MKDLVQGSLFGVVKAHLAVIEFQRRGLPHAHILLIMAEGNRLNTDDQVDAVICAELPPDPELAEEGADVEEMRRLQAIVVTNMIHGPCGTVNPKTPCMDGGKCQKGYPKQFRKHTLVDPASSFPTYRRRAPSDGGRTITIKRGGREFLVDNHNVVPYNPFVSLRYNCHINVEKSSSVKAARYINKYVTKGPDRAMGSAEVDGEERPRDEIADYKDLR